MLGEIEATKEEGMEKEGGGGHSKSVFLENGGLFECPPGDTQKVFFWNNRRF